MRSMVWRHCWPIEKTMPEPTKTNPDDDLPGAPAAGEAPLVADTPASIGVINQRIFDTSVDLILVVDRQGTLIRVSPSARSIVGYDPGEMIGRSARLFIHPPDLDSTRNEQRLARRGQTTRN